MRTAVLGVIFVSFLNAGCADKAEPDYARCVKAEAAGDLDVAWKACGAAVDADANSTSGKAATAKLANIKPKYEAWQADQEAKAAAASSARRKADAEARAEAARALRQKVSAKYWGFEPDDQCQSDGKPPFRKDYGGGTYRENETVALAEGCVHLFQPHSMPGPNDNTFCCPR